MLFGEGEGLRPCYCVFSGAGALLRAGAGDGWGVGVGGGAALWVIAVVGSLHGLLSALVVP